MPVEQASNIGMTPSAQADQQAGLNEWVGVLIAIVSSCLGGSAAAVTRYLVGNADPLTLAILRWGIGFLCVLPIALALRVRWPQRRDWFGVAGLGLGFFALFFVLYNIAVGFTTAARASLALSTLPLQTMLVGGLLGVEPLTVRKSAGVAIAVLGVLAALASNLAAAPSGAWRGELIMGGAVLCMAFYNVWSRPFIQRSSALGFLAVGMGVGAAVLVVVGVLTGRTNGFERLRRGTVDRRHLFGCRRRRARIHSLGAGAAEHDADAGSEHHDRKSYSGGFTGQSARR